MGTRVALLIGNGTFPNSLGAIPPLKAPRYDIQGVAEILRDPDSCRFEVAPLQLDADSSTLRVTLNRSLRRAAVDDLVLLYYAGHGVLERGQLYLCTDDTDLQALDATSVPMRELRSYIESSRCEQIILILDCCFSGAAMDEFRARTGVLQDLIDSNARCPGLHLLTSSGMYQPSLERDGRDAGDLPHGVYTRRLVEGIQTGEADINSDGKITPGELAEYIYAGIAGQTPHYSVFGGTGISPVIALNPWFIGEEQKELIRAELANLLITDRISQLLFRTAMRLLNDRPASSVDRQRKRLLTKLLDSQWQLYFPRAWQALAPGTAITDSVNPHLETFLTQQALDSHLADDVYFGVLNALTRDPRTETERRVRALLAAWGGDYELTTFVSAWNAIQRTTPPPACDSTGSEPHQQVVTPIEFRDPITTHNASQAKQPRTKVKQTTKKAAAVRVLEAEVSSPPAPLWRWTLRNALASASRLVMPPGWLTTTALIAMVGIILSLTVKGALRPPHSQQNQTSIPSTTVGAGWNAQELFAGGLHAFNNGDTTAAIAYWERAVEIDTLHTHAYYNLGVVYSHWDSLDAAANAYRAALRSVTKTPVPASAAEISEWQDTKAKIEGGMLSVGARLFEQDGFDEAIDLFKSLTHANPNNRDAWYNYALALYKSKRWQDLVPVARRVTEIDPLNENAHIILYNAYKGLAESVVEVGESARKLENQRIALAILERVEKLPIYVDGIRFEDYPDQNALLVGRAKGNAAPVGEETRLKFSFYGTEGLVGTTTISLRAPREGAETAFEVQLPPGTTVTSFSYATID